MKPWKAILLTIGLFFTCSLLRFLLFWLIIGTAIWMAVDSYKIGLHRYQSGISYRPVVLGLLCVLIWAIAFPWYLSVRYKILTGQAKLRDKYAPMKMSDGQIGENGLIQPWRGHEL